jgi:two-component system LytT family response regulator
MIVDDERLARSRLERLASAMSGVSVVGVYEEGAAALAALQEEAVDALLLDIDMPGLSGIDVGALLPQGGPRIIYTTAHPEHALAAFGVGALDYLLKPVDAARLTTALSRLRPAEAPSPAPAAALPLALPTRKGLRLLPRDSLSAAILDDTALYVLAGEERIMVDLSLQELEARLPDPPFVRVHRRALLNLEQVELLEDLDTGGYLARLKGGQTVAVSRQSARELRRRLG